MIGVEDLRNFVVESVNARDPELLEEADLEDSRALEETIETLNEQYPRLMMSHGEINGLPVGVVWMPDDHERYRQVAHVEVMTEDGEARADLVEGVDPALVAEALPGTSVAEWETASGDKMGIDRSI